MGKCRYCDQRKGKRACPALGEVCSACCGEHRGREIACPEDCAFLRPTRRDAGGSFSLWLERLLAFLFKDDLAWTQEAVDDFLDGGHAVWPWEDAMLLSWAAWGFVDERGERGVDRFLRLRHPSPEEPERKWIDALRTVWFSLFRITEVRRRVGLELEDLLTGRRLFVIEEAGTLESEPGGVCAAWIATFPSHHELAGPNCQLPPETAPAARSLLAADIPQPSGAELSPEHRRRVIERIPDLMRCMRVAARIAGPAPTSGEAPGAMAYCEAVYEVRDAGAVATGLAAQPSLVPEGAANRYRWILGSPEARAGEAEAAGWVEVRSVRLSLRTLSWERLEAGKRLLERSLKGAIAHRFDRVKDSLSGLDEVSPARTLEPGGRPPATPPGEDEAIVGFDRAIGDRIRSALFAQEEARSLFPDRTPARGRGDHPEVGPDADPERGPAVTPGARSDAARGGRHGQRRPGPQPEGEHHSLPLLGHEALCLVVPELRRVARRICEGVRKPGAEIQPVLGPDELMRQPPVEPFLREYLRGLQMEGRSDHDLLVEQTIVGSHLLCLVNHELQGRKTFWVDESLAWMLSQTDLDISGSCLRLPFPAFALVFTDPWTLDVAESLLSQQMETSVRGPTLRILTVHVIALPPEDPGVTSLNLSFLFDAPPGRWPYLLSRELWVRPEADLAGILESHAPEISPRSLDPVFLLPEMKRLVHLCINAILYAGSAGLDPIRLEPRKRRGEDRPSRGAGRRARRARLGKEAPGHSGEGVFFLPGKIPISHIERLRDLHRSEGGRKILKRFLVRGHWRRANPDWKDQRIRWIEPFWKGPDMARAIEKQYHLRP